MNLGAPGPGMIIFIIFSPNCSLGGGKMAKMAKKKKHLEIPIMMLNHQEIWIEVKLGAPGSGMIILSFIHAAERHPIVIVIVIVLL